MNFSTTDLPGYRNIIGEPDAAALCKLVTSLKGKPHSEFAGVQKMIPDSLRMLRPCLRPLSNIDEQQLLPILEAALQIQRGESEDNKLQLEPILKIQTAYKEVPEISRLALIEAACRSEEFKGTVNPNPTAL